MSVRNAYLLGIDVVAGDQRAVDIDVDDEACVGEAVVAEVEAASAPELTSKPNSDGGRTVDGGGKPGRVKVPRNAKLDGRVLKSEIDAVTDGQWTEFVLALKTAPLGAVSASNAMGMFEMKPRRLADIGLIENVRGSVSPAGRFIWVGDFVAPMTAKKFLSDAATQYKALGDSMRDYMAKMCDGTIDIDADDELPKGMSLSGALAILHRCGPSGLRKWVDEEERFSDTVALYEKCNEIF